MLYHTLIVKAEAVFHRLSKFFEILKTTDYLGFFTDIDNGKVVIFFADADDLMRGFEILDEWLPVQIGMQVPDVDKKWLWR